MIDNLKKRILSLSSFPNDDFVLEIFKFQAVNNVVYRQYLSYLNVDYNKVNSISQIPFLPVEVFKYNTIKTKDWNAEIIFQSSGTSGQTPSQHYVKDLIFYQDVAEMIFHQNYGPLKDYKILALLPSYLERNNSSLVYMVDRFIRKAKQGSGFFLDDIEELKTQIKDSVNNNEKVIIIGVSFALADWAEKEKVNLQNVIVMETGGMKGRREELTRKQLHSILKRSFNLDKIHSEYGMTELFSQCYSKGDGVFNMSTTMKIILKEANDPFSDVLNNKSGIINVIDLGNIDTCCFIATQDIGKINGSEFEILGRSDISEIRGCNLMIQDL